MASVVKARIKSGESLADLAAFIKADGRLTPDERTAALIEVQAMVDQARGAAQEAKRLNDAAWKFARFAPVTPQAVAQAVADARRALQLAPETGFYLNTLGVALYRAGQYQEAFGTLVRSDAINAKERSGSQPSDRAFLAMVQWKLGRADEARAGLVGLRELAAKNQWKDDEETHRFLEEAEALVGGPEPKP